MDVIVERRRRGLRRHFVCQGNVSGDTFCVRGTYQMTHIDAQVVAEHSPQPFHRQNGMERVGMTLKWLRSTLRNHSTVRMEWKGLECVRGTYQVTHFYGGGMGSAVEVTFCGTRSSELFQAGQAAEQMPEEICPAAPDHQNHYKPVKMLNRCRRRYLLRHQIIRIISTKSGCRTDAGGDISTGTRSAESFQNIYKKEMPTSHSEFR